MTKEDLDYIFKKQIDEGTTKLYFMLVDGERKVVERQSVEQIEDMLPMLDCFQYAGNDVMPVFVKGL
jgi:hypothetical protein